LTTHEVDTGRKTTEWNAANSAGLIALSPGRQVCALLRRWRRKSTGGRPGDHPSLGGGERRPAHDLGRHRRQPGTRLGGAGPGLFPGRTPGPLGGTDGSLRLWDLAAARELLAIAGPLRLGGDQGRGLLARRPQPSLGGRLDGLARLWDRATGALLREFPVSDDRFVALRRFGGLVSGWVAFTPDSQRIIYMGSDASFGSSRRPPARRSPP